MNQTQKYQLTTLALLITLTAFYLYTLNNNTQLQQTIQQLQTNNTQQQHQINTLQTTIHQQQNTITTQNITLETLFDNLGLSDIQVTELNNTLAEKSQLIIQYVNTLVDELYNFQYDKLDYIRQIEEQKDIIDELGNRISELEALLETST